MRETSCDVLIVGGGTGGCAAAMAACSHGLRVVMTEETDWVGGQLTSQAVPPDEHRWIERFGCTARYRRYRNLVRRYYRESTPLTPEAKAIEHLNPGGGWVSRLCHEPRIGWIVLCEMLDEYVHAGLLEIRLECVAVSATVNSDRVESVTVLSRSTGESAVVTARFVLDATELGDLLPMTGTEYAIGAESKSQTAEPNAVEGPPQPDNVQGITWVFAMAHDEGSHRVIDKPASYERWRAFQPDFWPGRLLGFRDINPQTGVPRYFPIFGGEPQTWYRGDFGLFSYRQIVDPKIFEPGRVAHPVTIVNWPQNDYFIDSILDVPPETLSQRLQDAKQLSLSLLYWLQTEAPRSDGGTGYPGLYMRPDITGTEDGFAKAPYIRESRRIDARFTVLEQDVAAYTNPGRDRGVEYPDSVGIGSYRIDLHPSTNGTPYIDTATLPFQIPLGSLAPVRVRNLIPACKNLGVSHITNGCYRLHPVEWNIGEAAGLLAAFSMESRLELTGILDSREAIAQLQSLLSKEGIELAWPDNLTD
jgi:hypothetical protein